MELGSFEIDVNEIASKLKKLGWKRIILEAPDGLKPYLKFVSEELQKRGFEVYLSGSGCYGPCDVDYLAAVYARADGIVHVGHGENLLGYKDFGLKEKKNIEKENQ
jgi:2-(3-amino-3-carboxypropyl)histidine synthase